MKKKVLNIVLLVIMILMVGCGNTPIAENFEMTNPTLSINEEPCNTEDNNIEEDYALPDVTLYSERDASDETIYNLKSVSVFITSRNEDLNEILYLSMTYISLKLETTTDVGTDLIKRESLKPRKITQFGKIITIDYDEYNLVAVEDIALNVKVVFTGFYECDEYTRECIVKLVFNESDKIPNLVGELLLDEVDELKLVFKAEIERASN